MKLLSSVALFCMTLCTGTGTGQAAAGEEAGQKTLTRQSCSSLTSLGRYEFTVDSAELIPASETDLEHCRVSGRILPQVGFALLLPSIWNRRMVMVGNGGWAGNINFRSLHGHMNSGAAAVSTDTGHDRRLEADGVFALDRQKLSDYGYRAVHVTALTARQIVAAYYQPALRYSYFVGCSTGGRQALMSAQRFPQDFDGISVGAPILNWIDQVLAWTWKMKAVESAGITRAHVKILADRVYARCDPLDGVEDGVINDPRECPFEPAEDLPLCNGESGRDDCFTSRQLEGLNRIYGGPISNGRRFFPGTPLGLEVFTEARGKLYSGWERLLDPRADQRYAVPFFRYMAFETPDPQYDWRSSFNLDTDMEKLEWLRPIVNATDPDLTRFRDGGGKMLMYHGWADTTLNPLMALEYYQAALAEMGPSMTDFFKLYMVPGMFHCGGGVGITRIDPVTPLMEWVEQSVEPQELLGVRLVDDREVYRRPVCPYPAVARYRGSGDPQDPQSWSCK